MSYLQLLGSIVCSEMLQHMVWSHVAKESEDSVHKTSMPRGSMIQLGLVAISHQDSFAKTF